LLDMGSGARDLSIYIYIYIHTHTFGQSVPPLDADAFGLAYLNSRRDRRIN
jgi:hypothetical protein